MHKLQIINNLEISNKITKSVTGVTHQWLKFCEYFIWKKKFSGTYFSFNLICV